MTVRVGVFVAILVGVILALALSSTGRAQESAAISGRVTSVGEGPMEGVLVSAKRAASTITVTVVSDAEGRYRFPASKLDPGKYTLRIRAVGYDLEGPREVVVEADEMTTSDLTLTTARDLASQLSNSEWLVSFPGTEQEKASIRACTHCHTLERIARSRHDVDGLTTVIERMSTYPQLTFPLKIQKLVAPRIGAGEISPEQRRATWRRQAQYLSTINLSQGDDWSYPLQTHQRPTGRATQVIYTEYDLPQRTRQPHDVIVDSQGFAWYASFGEQILGRLDPRTGIVTDYDVPLLKPNMTTGILGVRFDEDENVWLGMQFQGGVAKFDRTTETFQTWSLPPELNGDHVQINQVSPNHHKVDGKVWLQDAGTYTVLRLDTTSGTFEVFEPFEIPRPNIYGDLGRAEQRLLHGLRPREHRQDRCANRRDRPVGDADEELGPSPRHDRRARPSVVWREQGTADWDVRHGYHDVRGMGGADAGVVAVRRDGGHARRGMGGRRVQRPRCAPRPAERRHHGISASELHEYPAGVRGQFHDAGYLLGGEQSRRLDRQAGGPGLTCAIVADGSRLSH